ncbi:MAG TPA: DNA polymerase III subunit gamma/tau [Candidatus Baltobacteraceae bacterium]|nr:DNA polymerase III subunit gamma/tau [Candidatus Baltobacteraceae bacterium]
MSLYRTWRPRTFSSLVGQEAVVRTLETALRSNRLAHAYLFSGPRGCGKTSAAKIFARCINCRNGPTSEPDNTCDFCQAILAGTSLDVLEIDAASNRGIEEIRAIREAVKFAPAQMRSKVYIIDEAHMLTREGANAFLKTLEEPPEHVIFVLATTAPEALPQTILSRCQRYAFRRIPISLMVARMREIADAERIPIDDEALGALAYRADGGLRDALTMLEQVAAFSGALGADGCGDLIGAGAVNAAFGTTGREHACTLVDAWLAGDAAAALRSIDLAAEEGAEMIGLIRSVVAEFRHLLVGRIEPELLARDLSEDDATAVRSRAARLTQAKLVRGVRLLSEALAGARVSGNPRLELETATLRFILQGDDASLDALSSRIAQLEEGQPKLASPIVPVAAEVADPKRAAPAPPTAPAAPPTGSSGLPTLQQVRGLWRNVRTRIEEQYKPLRAPLSRATIESVKDSLVTIGIVDETQASILRDKTRVIEAVLLEMLNVPMRVLIRVSGAQPESVRRPAAVGEVDESDLLEYAMRQFQE